MGTNSGRHGRGRRIRAHRFVELAQPSLEPHPVHVRHQLQPVLNLEHQRRERVVQSLGLVRSFQRRRVRASCARAARGGRRVGAERRLEALLAHAADEERHVAAIRLGTRRARRRMRASGGAEIVSFVSTGDHNDRMTCWTRDAV